MAIGDIKVLISISDACQWKTHQILQGLGGSQGKTDQLHYTHLENFHGLDLFSVSAVLWVCR